jgi:hypothetical protein
VLRRLVLAGAVTAALHPLGARTAGGDAVVITGHVVAGTSGDPIRNARVTLTPEPPQPPVVLTDGDGTFRLTAPAGNYRVVASKAGYARGDARAAPGEPVEVRLNKGAVIAGRVVDESGEPVVDVKVTALDPDAGHPTTVATAETDDRGEYRLAGLPDGAFVVSVTTLGAVGVRPTARNPNPRMTYYPSAATIADAQALRVRPGDEREGTDIIVPADRLAGTPAGLFNHRFLPRPPPVAVQLGIVTPVVRPTGSVR